MKTIEEITKILLNEFSSVYCHNCAADDECCCDECHRKYVYWKLSEYSAIQIAEKILED